MKWFKFLLTYLGLFFCGVLTAGFIASTLVAYATIDNLGQKNTTLEAKYLPWVNPNLLELSSFGEQYRQELNLFDSLVEKVSEQHSPPLCSVICSPSFLDSERIKADRTAYLVEYFQHRPQQALKDPQFLIKLQELEFISELYPSSLRKIFYNAHHLNPENANLLTKISLALRLEFAALQTGWSLTSNWERIKATPPRLQRLKDIVRSCQRGTLTSKNAESECEGLKL